MSIEYLIKYKMLGLKKTYNVLYWRASLILTVLIGIVNLQKSTLDWSAYPISLGIKLF